MKNHKAGKPCKCKRKCFEVIDDSNRKQLLEMFNNCFSHKNEQWAYLASLMKILPVKQRRNPDKNSRRTVTFQYNIRIPGIYQETIVCKEALSAIFGVSNQTLRTIQTGLISTGFAPKDGRGHNPKSWTHSEEVKNIVKTHIKSHKGQLSHYSLKTSKKLYLPEELNQSKMYKVNQ